MNTSRHLHPRLLWRLEHPGGIALCADGARAALEVRTARGERIESSLWLLDTRRGGEPRPLALPAVRLSQVDLRRWPPGDPIAAEEAERKWREYDDKIGSLSGIVLHVEDDVYFAEYGKLRPVCSDLALRSWYLHLKPAARLSREQAAGLARGIPIVAPPLYRYIP